MSSSSPYNVLPFNILHQHARILKNHLFMDIDAILEGTILLEGINIDGKKEYSLYISRTFFKHLPVKQNVHIATELNVIKL